jgi:hypothetical protein
MSFGESDYSLISYQVPGMSISMCFQEDSIREPIPFGRPQMPCPDDPEYWDKVLDLSNWVASQPMESDSPSSISTQFAEYLPATLLMAEGTVYAVNEAPGRWMVYDEVGALIGQYSHASTNAPSAPERDMAFSSNDENATYWFWNDTI